MAEGPENKKDRATERGELMRYFMQKLNMTRARDGLPPMTMGRIGKSLQVIPTQDLYFLKSVCDDASKRGDANSFSKKFWWEISPKNHTKEAVQARARKDGAGFSRTVQFKPAQPKKTVIKKKSIESEYES